MSVFRAIFSFFCEIFLGCSHSHLARIFTVKLETYRVCLDCGKHIAYSPMTMRPLTARELRRMKVARAGELKIMPVTISSNAASQTVKNKSNVA
jgi:hypothetical protein